nr:ferritin-like fold-containing protein [Pseudoclavibacter alba]
MARVKSPFGRRESTPASSEAETSAASADPVSLAELAPSTVEILAQAAYIELVLFQELSDLVTDAPRIDGKHAIGQVAGEALERHESYLARLAEEGGERETELRRIGPAVDDLIEVVRGRDVEERLLSCFLVGGFLRDFNHELAAFVPGALQVKLEPLFDDAEEREALRHLLASMTEADALLAPRLAMWGRRTMGDCMLFVRERFGLQRGRGARPAAAKLVETFLAQLLANHSRRMNSLGMSA